MQYTIPQVAEMLKVTRQTVWLWIQLGKLRASRIGKLWVVDSEAIEEKRNDNATE